MSAVAKAGSMGVNLSCGVFRMRPTKIYSYVKAPEEGSLTGIYAPSSRESLIVGGPVDLWEFSGVRVEQERAAFLEKHGLKGMGLLQLQRWLDDNELSLPDVPRLDLPRMHQGDVWRLEGTFAVDCSVALVGMAEV